MDFLCAREYPGNIRELKQLVSRLVYHHVGPGSITPGDIPCDEWPADRIHVDEWRDGALESVIQRAIAAGATLRSISQATEATAVRLAVAKEGGSLQRAAARLGVTDRALQLRRQRLRTQILQSSSFQEKQGEKQ